MRFFTPAFIASFFILYVPQLVKSQAPDGFLTVNCQPLTIQRSDPIVNPGQVSGHTHIIIGGTAFQRLMGADTAKNAKETTCDKKLDKSNYWIPQLYHQRTDGTFELVTMQGSAVYYLNRVCDYAAGKTVCDNTKYAQPPPAGLRLLAGNPTLRSYQDSFEQRAISHMCLKENTSAEYKSLPPEACLRLRAQVFLPSCWDGKNLDSADHKSHMSYPAIGDYNGGVCPQSHPIAIFSIFYEFFFDTAPFPDYQNLVYAMGDKTGYGLHGDFINGWTDQTALANSLATCTGPQGVNAPTCSLNVDGSPGSASRQPLDVPAPEEPEPLGLDGPIAKLPGNNPITKRFVSRIAGSGRSMAR